MNPAFDLPCVHVVASFAELVAAPFGGAVNAVCWPRVLRGDFDEIVERVVALVGDAEITSLDEEDLLSLELSPAGELARATLIDDMRCLTNHGLDPNLDCIPVYPRETNPGPVPLDVYSWHADSANVLADTWLCSYTAPTSEGLRNDQAVRCVDDPTTRAALLQSYGGNDDEAFITHLTDRCYDLHYDAKAGAVPYSFGVGNLWRIATQCPGSPVLPCVHRAPLTATDHPPRLLMIT